MTSQNKEEKNLQSFKVVLMGDSGVGKTSIVNRYTKGIFEDVASTVGVGFCSKLLDFKDIKENCKLDVIIIFLIKIILNYRYGIQLDKSVIKV